MVAKDGDFLMIGVSVCLLEGFGCCSVCVVDGGNGFGVMRAWVGAGGVCGLEEGSFD